MCLCVAHVCHMLTLSSLRGVTDRKDAAEGGGLSSACRAVCSREGRVLFAYFHSSFSAHAKNGRQGGQATVCGQDQYWRFQLLSLPRCPCFAPRSIFSEGGRVRLICRTHPPICPFGADAACPGGDSRLVDCAKSSSLSPPSFLRRPPQSSPPLSLILRGSPASFIHSA